MVRAAGSKGFADLVAIKPTECGIPSHFEVRFIQIKVSVNLKNEIKTYQICTAPFGDVNVELLKFPVKVKSWYAKRRRVQKNKL